MNNLVPLLEESEAIFRYSWFSSRGSNMNPGHGANDLLNKNDSTPNTLGKRYEYFANKEKEVNFEKDDLFLS